MKRLLLVSLLALLVFAVSASATPVTCAASYANVTASPLGVGSTGCQYGNLVFSNFQVVSSPAGMQVGLASITTSSLGIALDFTVSGFSFTNPATMPDLRIVYEVTGGLLGVSSNFTNTVGPVTLTETVCNSAGVSGSGGACAAGSAGLVIPSFSVTAANSPQTKLFSSSQSDVWIIKDITVPAGTTGTFSFSEFVNTQVVPEPATFAMLGAGLMLFAFARRKKA